MQNISSSGIALLFFLLQEWQCWLLMFNERSFSCLKGILGKRKELKCLVRRQSKGSAILDGPHLIQEGVELGSSRQEHYELWLSPLVLIDSEPWVKWFIERLHSRETYKAVREWDKQERIQKSHLTLILQSILEDELYTLLFPYSHPHPHAKEVRLSYKRHQLLTMEHPQGKEYNFLGIWTRQPH